jgi:hypothetical protein
MSSLRRTRPDMELREWTLAQTAEAMNAPLWGRLDLLGVGPTRPRGHQRHQPRAHRVIHVPGPSIGLDVPRRGGQCNREPDRQDDQHRVDQKRRELGPFPREPRDCSRSSTHRSTVTNGTTSALSLRRMPLLLSLLSGSRASPRTRTVRRHSTVEETRAHPLARQRGGRPRRRDTRAESTAYRRTTGAAAAKE